MIHTKFDPSSVESDPFPVEYVPLHMIIPHEETDPKRVDEVAIAALQSNLFDYPVVLAKHKVNGFDRYVLLDGHHRMKAASTRLYATRVPAIVLDYQRSDLVAVDAWRKGEAVTKEIVLDTASEGRLLPIKTTRHFFTFDVTPCNTKLGVLVGPPRAHADAYRLTAQSIQKRK